MSQRKLTERTVVFLAPEQVEQIDNHRWATRKRSEAAAIRELIDLGLKAAQFVEPGQMSTAR
jgi:hypothetical protein